MQAPYSNQDAVWDAADHVYDNLVARGNLTPHLPQDASAAAFGAARAAAAAAVPNALVPVALELRLRCAGPANVMGLGWRCFMQLERQAPSVSGCHGCFDNGASLIAVVECCRQ